MDNRDFEAGVMSFVVGIPAFLAPRAYRGRCDLQNALIEYYTTKHDLNDDLSKLAKVRAAVYRKHNIPDTDIGRFELGLVHISTANAIPTLFWHLCFVCLIQRQQLLLEKNFFP